MSYFEFGKFIYVTSCNDVVIILPRKIKVKESLKTLKWKKEFFFSFYGLKLAKIPNYFKY